MPYEQLEHAVEIPRAGVTARRWRRFEEELTAWLATPDGRFAQYRARRELEAAPGAPDCAADAR